MREEPIDEGGFSIIYRGVYKFSEVLTVSNNIQLPLQPPLGVQEGEGSGKSKDLNSGMEGLLVRKLPM